MLVLSRKVGERIIIDERITVEVIAITSGGRVRLGLSAPSEIPIARAELLSDPDDKVSESPHRLVNAMTNCV